MLQIDETAEKLDSMMTQVFQYISRCQQSGQLVTTWQALLDSFFITVLNTHRSKFTQYLLWYILDMVRTSQKYKSTSFENSKSPRFNSTQTAFVDLKS